ncbi:MAG TPA: NADPH:quinone oxidoreductase family protein [Hyphomicrobium sp.]|jgi:NADPH2:quinone reductase|nr:NADPH:quinone oxidoreductase family protein [Hyphomicrobium sp.]
MKAALCKSLDGPRSLVIEKRAEPKLGPSQALVQVKAVGLNFADTLITRGKYQFKPDLPFSPGAEIAGFVETVADTRSDISPGQRVMAYVNWGGASEKIAVDTDALIPVPDDVPLPVAAGLSVTYGTAMHGLRDRGRLRSGETLVVTGAAGGAGQAAIEVAKLMQARVIAVASSPEKCVIAKAAGADDAIVFPGTDLKADVRAHTGGNGADVVYDCIGGEASEPLVRALAWQGRFLVVGFAAGEIPKIPLNLLMLRGAEMAGVFWGESVRRDPAGHRANMRQLLDWVAAGRLAPRIHATYPLDRIVEALGVLERREATGKVVLTID